MNQNTQYREYLIENAKFNRDEYNRLFNMNWEDEYDSEVDYEGDVARFGGIAHALECALETYDSMFPQQPTNDLHFSSIAEAYEYYWDESRNPNGNYDIEVSLIEGEKSFCAKYGLDWDEWVDYGYNKVK